MTILLLLVASALPILAAHELLRRTVPDLGSHLEARVLRIGLAVPLGHGASSVLAYAWLVLFGALTPRYALVDAGLCATVLVVARRGLPPGDPGRRAALGRLEAFALALAGGALLLFVARFVAECSVKPQGGWDAWTTWNAHARFLYRGGDGWRLAFDRTLSFSHNEYPLLVPAAVARLWAFSGESVVAPALLAGVFSLSGPLIVFGAVARRSGIVVAAMAAFALLATTEWAGEATEQYADVPLACLIAAAAAAATLAQPGARGATRRSLVLAGAFLSLATWTKAEGVLLAAIFGAWAALRRPAEGTPVWRRAAWLAAGGAVALPAWIHFHLGLPPGRFSDITNEQTLGTALPRLLDLARWRIVVGELPGYLPGAGLWLPAVVVGAVVLLGGTWRGAARSPATPALAVYATFVAVYTLTPLDLRWHLANSATRVLLQPWPAFVMGAFVLVPALEAKASRSAEAAEELRGR